MTSIDSARPPIELGLFTVDPPALQGGRCRACGALRFPFRAVCAECQSSDTSRVPLSTTGTVYTFTIVRSRSPGYSGEVPNAFGFVELPEGLRVIATIAASDLAALAVGDTVDFALLPIGAGTDAVLSYCYRRREGRR